MPVIFNYELLCEIKEMAKQQGQPVEHLMEEALWLYKDMQNVRLLEKQLPNGEYRVVTIHPYGVCVEHITKRMNVDSFKDIDILLEDGYYPILPKGGEDHV